MGNTMTIQFPQLGILSTTYQVDSKEMEYGKMVSTDMTDKGLH